MIPIPGQGTVIAVLVSGAACFAAGSYLGYQYADGQTAKDTVVAQTEILQTANEDVVIDMQAAYERGKLDAKVEARAKVVFIEGVKDATDKAKPECDRDSESVRLLNNAVDAANGGTETSGIVPESVSEGTEVDQRRGQGDTHLGIPTDRNTASMQSGT